MLWQNNIKGQNFGTIDLKKVNNSVVFLREVRNKTINQNGYNYQIGLKDPESGEFFPYKTEYTGTGFSIFAPPFAYVITVKHLAETLTDSSLIKFSGARLDTLFKLRDVFYRIGNKRWYFSDSSDIAVGIRKLNFSIENDTISEINDRDTTNNLFSSININSHTHTFINQLDLDLTAPFRDMDLLSIGYPSGIGNYKKPQTTISKFFRSTSEMLDVETNNPYFLIDDPSIDGFSGSPVFSCPFVFEFDGKARTLGNKIKLESLVGMVNGTYNDTNGGKFTSVIPSKLIMDVLVKTIDLHLIDDFFYPNGALWQEKIVKNLKTLEVLCNYDKNGKHQEKGTLKNGDGTIIFYNEEGMLWYTSEFKNGVEINRIYPKNDKK